MTNTQRLFGNGILHGGDYNPDQWRHDGSCLGYKRVCRFEPIRTKALGIRIEASRGDPTLAFVGAYVNREEERLKKSGTLTVEHDALSNGLARSTGAHSD